MAIPWSTLATGCMCAPWGNARRLILLVTLLGVVLFWPPQRAAATVIELTDLGADFRPMDIDIEGRIAGRRISTGRAAIWEDGGFTNLGTLGGPTSVGNAIYQGQVVGTSAKLVGQRAFYYGGFMYELPIPPFASATLTGDDINANGQKLGNMTVSNTKVVVMWDAADEFHSGLLDVTGYAINDAGDGVGFGNGTGYYWHGTNIKVAARTFSTFNPSGGINNERLIGGVLNGTTAATVQIGVPGSPTAIPNIHSLGSTSSVAGVNNANEIVGNTNSTVFYYNYDSGALVNLNAATFMGAQFDQLLEVQAISDPGFIVGTGLIGGVVHGFKADLLSISIAGDYNGDGFVTEADYLRWRSEYGRIAVPAGSGADGNRDGIVDGADYTFWRNIYGNGGTGQGGLADAPYIAVPEPSSMVMALGAFISILLPIGRARS